MVEAKALIFRLEQEINRLNTEHKKHIKIVHMCDALSRAQRLLLKERVQRAKMDKRVRHEIMQLEMKEVPLTVKKPGKVTIIEFPKDYFRDSGIRIIAAKRGCGKKEIPLTKMDTQDIAKSLDSPFWKSSYAWEQCFGDEGAEGFFIYNGDDFKVDGMIIDYYKRPPDIHCPSKVKNDKYIDWNGKEQTEDSGWILDDLADEGVNEAALILTRGLGDGRDFQLQATKAVQTEQISKL